MRINVFDDKMNSLGFLASYIYLDWNERYYEPGTFTLQVVDDEDKFHVSILRENYYLYMTDRKTAMQIERVEYNSATKIIVVNGHTALNRLRNRLLDTTLNVNNVEVGMREAFTLNRRDLSMEMGTLKGFTDTHVSQHSHKEILTLYADLCAASSLGVQVLFDHENKKQIIDIYKGVDRTEEIKYTDTWGQLSKSILSLDSTIWKNVAYVYGEGEGDDRVRAIVGNATGDDRRELYVDAKDMRSEGLTPAQYAVLLQARGIEKINENLRIMNFSQEVNTDDFGKRFDLGDIITTINFRYGLEAKFRVMQFKRVSENNAFTTKLIYGNPQISILRR